MSGGQRVVVPCSKCFFCLQSKRAAWSFRIEQEHKRSNTAYFLTLTYEDGHLPINEVGEETLRKTDYQAFMKRLRRCVEPVKLRYYSVGEYGDLFDRPHYHSIMFNLPQPVVGSLDQAWQKGYVHVGSVSRASIHYVTGYVINRFDVRSGREPPFSVMSRRPGIGYDYVEKYKEWHRSDFKNYAQSGPNKHALPRYYREKLFSVYERAFLAEQSILEAQNRYIDAISKLYKFHSDPCYYYDERRAFEHEQIGIKSSQQSKIF